MIEMFKHLLPTGRAWRLTINKRLRQFFDGLSGLIDDTRSDIDLYYGDIDPQTTRELPKWESQFGLLPASLTEQERRDRLDSAWKPQANQSPQAIQDTLRAAGFDVYVYEWWDDISGRPAGGSVNGDAIPVARDPFTYLFDGNGPTSLGYPLVNKIQVASVTGVLIGCGHNDLYCAGNLAYAASGGNDITYSFKKYTMPADVSTYQYYIYIGAAVFPNHATIAPERKEEFEDLCLKICPTEQWIGILANDISTSLITAVPINFVDVIDFDVWGTVEYSLDGGATFNNGTGQPLNISGVPSGNIIVNDTGNDVTRISFRFKDFFKAITIYEMSGSITSADNMFKACLSLESVNLNNFNTVSVTNMYAMFGDCKSLVSIDVKDFDSTSLTATSYMFDRCDLLKYVNLTNFNIGSVTYADYMFRDSFNLICITNINTVSVIVTDIFSNTPSLIAPNAADQLLIEGGYNWVNPSPCP